MKTILPGFFSAGDYAPDCSDNGQCTGFDVGNLSHQPPGLIGFGSHWRRGSMAHWPWLGQLELVCSVTSKWKGNHHIRRRWRREGGRRGGGEGRFDLSLLLCQRLVKYLWGSGADAGFQRSVGKGCRCKSWCRAGMVLQFEIHFSSKIPKPAISFYSKL